MNQKIRIELFHDGHNIVEYPDEASYNTCSNAEILVELNSNLSTYDIALDYIGTRYKLFIYRRERIPLFSSNMTRNYQSRILV